jgi:D-tyrosyl-tRNA(Tyr) deacylase
MKGILVRVNRAEVIVEDKITVSMGKGIVFFVGIGKSDTQSVLADMADRIVNLRIFEDTTEKLNYSIKDTGYEILCVPNFTLYANMTKGRRPSFDDSMPKASAKDLFNRFIEELKLRSVEAKAGAFGKHMNVRLEADGPVNLILGGI